MNLINTRGAQSVINPINKTREVYICTADLSRFLDSFSRIPSPPLLRTTTIGGSVDVKDPSWNHQCQ